MAESFPVPRVDLSNLTQVSTSTATNPLQKKINPKSQALFEKFFDTPEKCQMIINAIKNNELGDKENCRDLISILEQRKYDVPNGRGFTINEQLQMTNYDYVIKELNFVVDSEKSGERNPYQVKEKDYERVLKRMTSAKDCQLLIDKILDKNKYRHFDTQQEARELLFRLEEKKREFEDANVDEVQEAAQRDSSYKSRSTNEFILSQLIKKGEDISADTKKTLDETGHFDYAGLFWKNKVCRQADPCEQILNPFEKHLDSVSELRAHVDKLSIEDFGKKVEEVLGKNGFDSKNVSYLMEKEQSYLAAKNFSYLQKATDLKFSEENLAELEKMYGGKDVVSDIDPNYVNLTPQEKYDILQNVIKQNMKENYPDLSVEVAKKEIEQYETKYQKFLEQIGLEDKAKELQKLRDDAEISGMITVPVATIAGIAAATLVAAEAGAAAIGAGVTAGVAKIGAALTAGVGAGFVSYGVNKADKTNFGEKEITEDDKSKMQKHALVDGALTSASMGTWAVASKAGNAIANVYAKFGTRVAAAVSADAALATAATYAHAGIDDRAVTGEELAANLAFSLVGTLISAVAMRPKSKVNVQPDSHVSEPIQNRLYPNGPTSENVEMPRSTDFDSVIRDLDIQQGVVPPQPPKPVMPKPAETPVQVTASERPSTVQKPEATSIPVINNTQTKVYKKKECFHMSFNESLNINGFQLNKKNIEAWLQNKKSVSIAVLDGKKVTAASLKGKAEGHMCKIRLVDNGYLVEVIKGEVKHIPSVTTTKNLAKSTNLDGTKQPMGQDIQVVQGKPADVPPSPVDLKQQALAPVATKATQTKEYINEQVSAISDSFSLKNSDGKYINLQKQSCVEAVGLDDTKVKLGDTEICLSKIEGLSTKLSKDISAPVPVYIVNGEFRLKPKFRLLKNNDPVFYVAKEGNGAITLNSTNPDISVTNVRKPELWRRDNDFEKLPTTPSVVSRYIEFIGIDGNRFVLNNVYGLDQMKDGITYHVIYDGERYCVATLENATDSTGVFIRKTDYEIEAFGTNGRGAGIMKPEVYNKLENEWFKANIRRRN